MYFWILTFVLAYLILYIFNKLQDRLWTSGLWAASFLMKLFWTQGDDNKPHISRKRYLLIQTREQICENALQISPLQQATLILHTGTILKVCQQLTGWRKSLHSPCKGQRSSEHFGVGSGRVPARRKAAVTKTDRPFHSLHFQTLLFKKGILVHYCHMLYMSYCYMSLSYFSVPA